MQPVSSKILKRLGVSESQDGIFLGVDMQVPQISATIGLEAIRFMLFYYMRASPLQECSLLVPT